MSSLPSYVQFSREVWIGAGVGFVGAIALMWLLVWFGRRRYVTIGNSPTVEMVAYQLGRIADTLNRISIQGVPPSREFLQARQNKERQQTIEPAHESPEVPSTLEHAREEAAMPAHRISMSMFGR